MGNSDLIKDYAGNDGKYVLPDLVSQINKLVFPKRQACFFKNQVRKIKNQGIVLQESSQSSFCQKRSGFQRLYGMVGYVRDVKYCTNM
jgi:hypothetical protein